MRVTKKPQTASWREKLRDIKIQPYTWQCQVGFFAEFNVNFAPYIDNFNIAAESLLRPSVRIISPQILQTRIRVYGNSIKTGLPSEGLGPDTSLYPTACDEALHFHDSNQPIPAELLSKIIKLEILRLKEEQIQTKTRENQLKQAVEDEFQALKETAAKVCPQDPIVNPISTKSTLTKTKSKVTPSTKMSSKKSSKPKSKSPSKKVAPPAPEIKPRFTKLLKHGEEWRNQEFIQDSPKGGANLYVILTGFYDVNLLFELLKDEVPLLSIIQLRNDEDQLDEVIEIPEPLQVTAGHSQSSLESVNPCFGDDGTHRRNMIRRFWDSYIEAMEDVNLNRNLETVALITFDPPELDWIDDVENSQQIIYERFSYLMYDINDIQRQYENYLRNTKLINVDLLGPIISSDQMHIYRDLLDQVPAECISIPIIINCLLEQITDIVNTQAEQKSTISLLNSQTGKSRSTVSSLQSSRTSEKLSQITIHNLNSNPYAGHSKRFLRIFNKVLEKHNHELESSLSSQTTDPITVIQYGNDIKLNTFHVDHLGLEPCALSVLLYHVVPLIWDSIPELSTQDVKSNTARLYDFLAKEVNQIDQESIWYQLHLKVFEKMECTSPLSKRSITKTQGVKCSLAPAVSLASISSNSTEELFQLLNNPKPGCFQNFNSIQHLDLSIMLQQLFQASLSHTCLDYHYFPYTDTLLIRFHNPYSGNGIIEDNWTTHLPTLTCFRDFVEYVYNEIFDWILLEERKYQSQLELEEMVQYETEVNRTRVDLANIFSTTKFEPSPIIPQREDYLLQGSIKARILKEEELKRAMSTVSKISVKKKDKKSKSSKSPKSPKSPKTPKSPKSPKSVKKTKSPRSVTKKPESAGKKKGKVLNMKEQQELLLFPPLRLPMEPISKFPFSAYNLRDTRVELLGTTNNISLGPFAVLRMEKSSWLNGSNSLHTEITKNDHSLYLHTKIQQPQFAEKPFTFHLVTKNGIILAFSKGISPYVEETPESSLSTGTLTEITDSSTKVHTQIASSSRKPKQLQTKRSEKKLEDRFEMEQLYNKALLFEEVLKPEEIRTSQMLKKTKAQIIDLLTAARKNFAPVYKIHSSKLHKFKYIKAVKKHVTVNPVSMIDFLNGIRKNQQSLLKPKVRSVSEVKKKFQRVPMFYDFKATLPSGLTIETLPSYDLRNPVYVRQRYLSKGPACGSITDESYRCFLSNGNILIFKTDGSLKILCADGRIFVCQIDSEPDVNTSRKSHRKRPDDKYKSSSSCMDRVFKKIMRSQLEPHLIRSSISLSPTISRRLYTNTYRRNCKILEQPELHGLIPFPEYTVLSANGSKTTVLGKKISSLKGFNVVETYTDLCHNEIYTTREDGLTSLLTTDGTLITTFPDGSRIYLGFIVEENEVFLDLTPKENEKMFYEIGKDTLRGMKYRGFIHRNSIRRRFLGSIATRIPNLEFSGYVSIVLTCRFEHPNYAMVEFQNRECSLVLPQNVSINIGEEYKCNLDDKTNLEVRRKILKFTDSENLTVVNIAPFTCNEKTCFYIESFHENGKKVLVDFQGNFEKTKKKSVNENQDQMDRLFILERSLEGTEFISDNEKQNYINSCVLSSDRIQSGKEPGMCPGNYSIITKIIEKNRSQQWLVPYTVPEITPKAFSQKGHLPSTYYPGDWLSAFPKAENNTISNYSSSVSSSITQEPKIFLFRKLINITIPCERHSKQPILQTPAEVPKGLPSKSPSIVDIYHNRNDQIKFFKNLIFRKKLPKYFSREVEKVMYFPDCKIVNLEDDAGDNYIPDLEKLTCLWNGYKYDEVRKHRVKSKPGYVPTEEIKVEVEYSTPKETPVEKKVHDNVEKVKCGIPSETEVISPVQTLDSWEVLMSRISSQGRKIMPNKQDTGAKPYVCRMALKKMDAKFNKEENDDTTASSISEFCEPN